MGVHSLPGNFSFAIIFDCQFLEFMLSLKIPKQNFLKV